MDANWRFKLLSRGAGRLRCSTSVSCLNPIDREGVEKQLPLRNLEGMAGNSGPGFGAGNQHLRVLQIRLAFATGLEFVTAAQCRQSQAASPGAAVAGVDCKPKRAGTH